MNTRRVRSGRDGQSGEAARTRPWYGSGRSSRQAGAALVPAGLEHSASSAGAHASAKTVLLRTTAGIGLICTLHELLRDFGTVPDKKIGRCSRQWMQQARPSRWLVSGCDSSGYGRAWRAPNLVRRDVRSTVGGNVRSLPERSGNYTDVTYSQAPKQCIAPAHALVFWEFCVGRSPATVPSSDPQVTSSTICGKGCGSRTFSP